MDPELEDLFRDDPSLGETARLLRAARPDPEPDQHFRNRLRVQLVAEAQRSLRPRGLRRWLRVGPGHLAWAGAALGTAAIAATAVALFSTHVVDHQTVTAYSTIAARHAVSPSDVITVAFNQPMNHARVEGGLHIEPATQVTTTWKGNDLVITPLHHLAGNTPYTVTIVKPALVAASGATAARPLQISFGTAPTPPPAPAAAPPPALQLADLGAVAGGSSVLFAPDGAVVSTAGYPPATASSPSPGATARPTPTAVSSPTTAPPPGSSSSPALLEYGATGSSTSLGPAATAAGFAPGGASLAAAVSDGSGGSEIILSQADGTQSHVLVDSRAPIVALTWATGGTIVYATSSSIASVDLAGATHQLATPAGNVVELAPGGAYAYLAPSGGQSGQLLDINAGSSRALNGATDGVAFSGDGSTVAWVSTAGAQPTLVTEPVGRDASASVSVPDPGAGITSLALNHDGTAIAYTLTPDTGAAKLVVAQLPSGTPSAIGPATSSAVFSPRGDALALLTASSGGMEAQRGSIPGSAPASTTAIPVGANSTLRAFVDAQARGDSATLTPLTASGVDAAARTPSRLSRSYVVDAVVQSDGSVKASVELIVDPTTSASAQIADETLTLSTAGPGQPYLVTGLEVTPLHNESSGPHVVNVSRTATHAGFIVQISFDSDLNPLTVPGAFSVVTADGTQLMPEIAYNPDSRTAVVTLPRASTGRLTLTVGSALRDVNGQAIASAFHTQVLAG